MLTAQQVSRGNGIPTGIERHTGVFLLLLCKPMHARVTAAYKLQHITSTRLFAWEGPVLPVKSSRMQ